MHVRKWKVFRNYLEGGKDIWKCGEIFGKIFILIIFDFDQREVKGM